MSNQILAIEDNSKLVDLYNKTVEQNRIIQTINRQLTDSLQYAGKLQKAVIPPREYIDKVFPNNFVLYKPKHFVSGDFYWIYEKGDKAILAVADCTGHGVPGALMSILGITCLNEISNLYNQSSSLSASDILNLLRTQIISSLHQTGEPNEMKDGMDIALCIFDRVSLQVQYAGGFIPLYIVRNQSLTEYRPDNMPIGIYELSNDFSEQLIQLEPGDMVYLFTDGYADQFGGLENKKFKGRNLRPLLEKISELRPDEQRNKLKETLSEWQGQQEQIDDITAIGVRVGDYPSAYYAI